MGRDAERTKCPYSKQFKTRLNAQDWRELPLEFREAREARILKYEERARHGLPLFEERTTR